MILGVVGLVVGGGMFVLSAAEELELLEERYRDAGEIVISNRAQVEGLQVGLGVDTLPWEACSDRYSPWPVVLNQDNDTCSADKEMAPRRGLRGSEKGVPMINARRCEVESDAKSKLAGTARNLI